MQNNGGDPVRVGSTQKDEMCNFYVMYWVEGEHLPTDSYCFTEGPPNWSWSDFGDLDLDLVPDTASVLPGFEDVTGEDSLLLGATKQELEEVFFALFNCRCAIFSSEQPPISLAQNFPINFACNLLVFIYPLTHVLHKIYHE